MFKSQIKEGEKLSHRSMREKLSNRLRRGKNI